MDSSACQSLADYVAHDLAGEDLARFEAHLPTCSKCQRAIREEGRLDALLGEAVRRLDPIPEGLADRVARRMRTVRRRRIGAVVAALAASVVVVSLVVRFLPRPDPVQPTEQVEVRPDPPVPEDAPNVVQVRVTFPKAAGLFAVPVPSESPNVTVFRVYTGLREPRDAEHNEEASLPIPERIVP
jgi:anti-sigma factor RsiW